MAAVADFTIRQADTLPVFADTLVDATGTAVNLTGATVTFTLRAQTATAPAALTGTASITSAATGQVQFAWAAGDTATAGMFAAEWHVTFSGGGTRTFPVDGYRIVSIEPNLTAAGTGRIVGLGEVKDWLRIPASDEQNDVKLVRLIDAATPLIEGVVGPVIVKQYEEWYDGGVTAIQLRRQPVVTLIAVSEFRGPVEYPLALVGDPAHGSVFSAMLDPEGRLVRRAPGGGVVPFLNGLDVVHVIYTAGRSVIPSNISLATLELIRENFDDTQEGGRPAAGGRFGDPDAFADTHPTFGPFLSTRVRSMLVPTRRHPSVA